MWTPSRRAARRTARLLAYAPNAAQQWNRSAMFVDKILKDVKPADRPDHPAINPAARRRVIE
jgi:hypothetical protein